MDDAELVDSISRRARKLACESCGSKTGKWSIQEDEVALIAVGENGPDLSSGVPVRAVICSDCGFVRLYSTMMGG